MQFMMEARPRLLDESELPKIDFSLNHKDLKHDTQYDKQAPFF